MANSGFDSPTQAQETGKTDMSNIPTGAVEVIEGALREGCKLRAFLSGGGLRVLRLEKYGDLRGYGEHPHIEDAFVILSEDYKAGGREYSEVYGKVHTHYLTGSQNTTSQLDLWIRQGSKFETLWDGEKFVFVLKGWKQHICPDGFEGRALRGENLTWKDRGYTYRISPSRFPNGTKCVVTSVVSSDDADPEGDGPWMYRGTKTGSGQSLNEAIDSAFESDFVESKW